jgi:hypothetical protein
MIGNILLASFNHAIRAKYAEISLLAQERARDNRSAPEGAGSPKRLPCFSQVVVCDHCASPAPTENDACGLRSLRTGCRLDISQDMCCVRRVVKGAKTILELGNRVDVGSRAAEKKAEKFRRVANVLECYSNLVSFLGRLVPKPTAPFESALVESFQSLASEESGWLGQPQQFSARQSVPPGSARQECSQVKNKPGR